MYNIHHHNPSDVLFSYTASMRLTYIPKDPQFTDPYDQATVSRVKQRRGSAGLIELDRALLHAPPVADGW
jgi:hypothetical protein